MLPAVILIAVGLWSASGALATPGATVTAACGSGSDGSFDVTVNNTSTNGEQISSVSFSLNGSGVKVTGVTGPSSGYGSGDGGGTGEWDFNSPLPAGQSVTFHVTTSPSACGGTFNATVNVTGGGTIQLNDVQVKQASACQPEDPQGRGQLDTVCPSGKKEEEEAKPLEVGDFAYSAANHKRLISSFRKGEEAYFYVAIQNPNDDPIAGTLHDRLYGVEFLRPSQAPIRDVRSGLTDCATHPSGSDPDENFVNCVVHLPADGSASLRVYGHLRGFEGQDKARYVKSWVSTHGRLISDGQRVDSGYSAERSVFLSSTN